MKKIWLSAPHMGGKEIEFINNAFLENWIAPLGPNVNGFESDLETFLETDKKVAALSSGTAAIHLALLSCGVKANDEVICQTLTFAASANPITYIGATPVFVDSELDSWNMCPLALEEAIIDRIKLGKNPKAIIAVHLYGMPYNHNEIHAVAEKYQIPVIEDAAEALGSTYFGKKCGTLGDYGILSFNGNKIITTSGGGALVCNDQILKNHILHLSTQAKDDKPYYEHSSIGYNYRMSNVVAGIGRGQMEVLPSRVLARRANNQFYREIFKEVSGVYLQETSEQGIYSNNWLTALYIDPEKASFTLADFMDVFSDNNIECRHVWKPMHKQPVYKNMPYYGANNAEYLFENGLCLPSGSNLSEDEKQFIKEIINSIIAVK